MSLVFPFGEGQTERVVFDFLRTKFFPDQGFKPFVPVGGKSNFHPKIKRIVRSEILSGKDVCILVFRDLDAGETHESVAQSFRDLIWILLSKWDLRPNIYPLEKYPNIYVCVQSKSEENPGLRLVLHLADNEDLGLPGISPNHTTDGYVLAAGLTDAVLRRFAESPQVNSSASILRNLIVNSIPGAITQAKIAFSEYKDYLAAYLCASRFWVVHRTEEQARLVEIILKRAWKYDQGAVHRVFDSWRAAIEEAVR